MNPKPTLTPTPSIAPLPQFYLGQISRRKFMLAALVATDALWSSSPSGPPPGAGPFVLGRFVDRGQDAFVEDDVWLRQDQQAMPGAPDLDAGATNPRGYWNGGVRQSGFGGAGRVRGR
jgi:hypothetical protein